MDSVDMSQTSSLADGHTDQQSTDHHTDRNSIDLKSVTMKDSKQKKVDLDEKKTEERDMTDIDKYTEDGKSKGDIVNKSSDDGKKISEEVKNTPEAEEEKNGDVMAENTSDDQESNRSSSSSVPNSRKRSADSALIGCNEQPSKKMHSSDEHPSKKMHSSSPWSDLDSLHQPEDGGMTVGQLMDHMDSVKKKGLLAEYTRLKREMPAGTFNHSRARLNLAKNRYTDVLCYDHSRVKLEPTNDLPCSDYINASLVDGYRQKNAYIAAQGPLPNTFADFWRMVWQYQCRVIVMTTRTVERQRTKCGQYWPAETNEEMACGPFVVRTTSITPLPSYVDSTLLLTNTANGESREVHHLQFITWPDHGVPPAPPFLHFLSHVRTMQDKVKVTQGEGQGQGSRSPPVVVHCSAGIGRTGTFMTVDINLLRLKDTGKVDVLSTVRKIRSQRALSIQTPDQYVFCYQALVRHAQNAGLVTDKRLASEEGGSDSDDDDDDDNGDGPFYL